MSQEPGTPRTPKQPSPRDDAVAVISAYGAFRLLIVLVGVWSFVEGFALFAGRVDALTLGGSGDSERAAEQIMGAHMIVLVPVYALLAWRREQYRVLFWMPYAAQLAIILPLTFSLLRGHPVGVPLLIVSLVFFSLLIYFWWQSHPLEFFQKTSDAEPVPPADALESEDDESAPSSASDASAKRRYRRQEP